MKKENIKKVVLAYSGGLDPAILLVIMAVSGGLMQARTFLHPYA